MTPIEQAKALAAEWREEADALDRCFHEADEYVARVRKTAALLKRLAAELERP